MKNKISTIFLLVWSLVFSTFLTGCVKSKPPSEEEIYAIFQESHSDIQIVANYLLAMEYKVIFYPTSEGEVFADFERIPLDNSINDATYSLMKKYKLIRFSKRLDDNALVFKMWTDQLECECGVVYAINNNKVPHIQYLTLLEPLPEVGWYYYVADYNEWRANNS